jgi:hypothetical protein
MSALNPVCESVSKACGYFGTLKRSLLPLVSLDTLCESLALVGFSKVVLPSLGAEGLLLLLATLGSSKMLRIASESVAGALPAAVDLQDQFPRIFGEDRLPSLARNCASAALVAAVSRAATDEPLFMVASGGGVLFGAGASFVLKKVWDKCCGANASATAGAGAGGPSA